MAEPFTLTIDGQEVQAYAGPDPAGGLPQERHLHPDPLPFRRALRGGGLPPLPGGGGGGPKLLPTCVTQAHPNQKVHTNTEKLQKYRKMIVELFFSERNHICAVCVANNNCELQDLAKTVGMDHVRFPYLQPKAELDPSHDRYVIDHNRCVMCTRCVRVCDEVEGAHVWDVMGRGTDSRIVAGIPRPLGRLRACTWCGKCSMICPVGAIWPKEASQGKLLRFPNLVTELVEKRNEP